MIRFLSGQKIYSDDRSLILDVNGVGYQVFGSLTTLHHADLKVQVWVHTHVREDEITLYGFLTHEELKLFETLLDVNGVGPKVALSLLNQPIDQLRNAIDQADPVWLSKTPGVGKKTAERIVLELAGKLNRIESATGQTAVNNEAVTALEQLGYKRNHIENLFKDLPEEVQSTEEKVRWFLERG